MFYSKMKGLAKHGKINKNVMSVITDIVRCMLVITN